ncbi:N-acetylmuramoyl-L-alanine amidase [Modestobacter sp. VKM Ac-2986]|uniref:N-acetylmuramoyl-L-alanine amidase n=1 Tax=Modestobacter sp. VKM Ac-2986 TaxID=3004140 RepID=UPI0022AB8022|nr:N-acetylmuramoyl-L-alanine amidase [Modestobacter sp. VKM Ac-2986]MCZ2829738.1 N-acetylmuramoyl-L-alanine amidase [Modestobacter sp. VKM Ac-2986]
MRLTRRGRRVVAGAVAALGVSGVLVVLPVVTRPQPQPVPVVTSTEAVPMGSVEEPAPGAAVATAPATDVPGATAEAPVLTVSRPDTGPFSLVGVTWSADEAVTDTVVRVRTRPAAEADWGGWTEIAPEATDQDAGTGTGAAELRGGTAPLWTGASTGVEVELVTRSGARPADVRLDLVDPGTSEADASLGEPAAVATAHAADPGMPPVFSRAQWGADERIRTWDPEYAPTIEAATVHHTADSNDYAEADVPAIMRSIYRYHTVSRGWGDIGYNVIVDKFGRMWEGRYGGLASTVVGAHAVGYNTGTFGVSMLGNYDLVPVPQATVDAVSAIIAWKFSLFGVDPRGTARLGANNSVSRPTVHAHRDVGQTACPGRYGYARLGEIRDEVAAQVQSAARLVQQRYDSDAAVRALLGARTSPVTAIPGGAFAHYANGSIYASMGTGARVVRGPVKDRWAALGWENSSLGWPVGDTVTGLGAGGSFQEFQRGAVYWSPGTGARVVPNGAVRDRWAALGWERGALGYPVGDAVTGLAGGGSFQDFERGSLYWSPGTGAQVVTRTVLREKWGTLGWERGALGYPVRDAVTGLAGGGSFQDFERGSVYWSPGTGARVVMAGALKEKWGTTGWEGGRLGYPVGDQTPLRGGAAQFVAFQRGSVYWSAPTGAHAVEGVVRDRWAAAGWENGPLGLPLSDVGRTPDGAAQFAHFEGGSVYAHATLGARVLSTVVREAWGAAGWERGPLGYPVADAVTAAGGRGQLVQFQGGQVLASAATGGHAVSGVLLTDYEAAGGPGGGLGLPTADAGRTGDGRATFQHFEGGSLYRTSAGVVTVPAAVRDVWARSGWEHGPLGYPAGAATVTAGSSPVSTAPAGGTTQVFQGGTVYVGQAGAFPVSRAFEAVMTAVRDVAPLGWPTGEVLSLAAGGSLQTFERGSVYASPATGAHAVAEELFPAWGAAGWEYGPLGYPTTDTVVLPGGGRFVHFQGGSVYWTAATGAHVVRGAVRDAWARSGWEGGLLGHPTGEELSLAAGGSLQQFERGSVYASPATGARAVAQELFPAWGAAGWEYGPLGYPTTDTVVLPGGGRFVHFQGGGSVYWTAATGAHVVRGAVRDAWARYGWEGGRLGYPVSEVRPLSDGGAEQDFQGGTLRVSITGSASIVTVR